MALARSRDGARVPTRVDARDAGHPVHASIRAPTEAFLGVDFSGVRVHATASDRAQVDGVGAKAFTLGQDIFLGTGASEGDLGLMAHELTHVVQQRHPWTGPAGAGAQLSRSGPRVMRADWSAAMVPHHMPTCGAPSHAVFPSEGVDLGHVPGDARHDCRYTPLFHVPEFRLPDGRHRVTVRARVSPTPVGCEERDWSINVYECFGDGTSRARGCAYDHTHNYAGGRIAGPPLEVIYPRGRRWSTRNLSVRISNGCERPIRATLQIIYPSMPEPTVWEQISEGVHIWLDLLGLTEPFGVFFDGANAVIYAAEGQWLQAGLSVGAMIPAAGAGATTLRRMIRGGEDVIGMEIRRAALRQVDSAQVAAAIRQARADARAARQAPTPRVPRTRVPPREPPRGGGGSSASRSPASSASSASRARAQVAQSGVSMQIGTAEHLVGTFQEAGSWVFGICTDCASLARRLQNILDALPANSPARGRLQELFERVVDADVRLARGRAGYAGRHALDPSLEATLSRTFRYDLNNIVHEHPSIGALVNAEPHALLSTARRQGPQTFAALLRQHSRTSLIELGIRARGSMQLAGSRLIMTVEWVAGREHFMRGYRNALAAARHLGVSELVIRGRPSNEWATLLERNHPGMRRGEMVEFVIAIAR